MPDRSRNRISRELFLAGFGMDVTTIDPWVLDRMTSMLDEQDYRAGDTIYAIGDPPTYLYFMHDGAVRLSRPGHAPWTFQGRWLLGIFDAFTDRGRVRDAVALKDFHAMKVPVADWLDLLEDSPSLARAAVLNSSAGLARLEERVPKGLPRPPRLVSPLGAAHPGPLTLVDRLAALVDVRMLRGAGVQALVDLAAASEEVSFEKDQLLFPRGFERRHMLLLVDGEVRATRQDPSVERNFGPGDVAGGVCAFGPQALPWEVRALSFGRGVAFPIEAWVDLMEEHFDLVRSVLSALLVRRELLLEHLAEAEGEKGIVLT